MQHVMQTLKFLQHIVRCLPRARILLAIDADVHQCAKHVALLLVQRLLAACQKTEDRGQKTVFFAPLPGAFTKGAAPPRQNCCPLSSVLCHLYSSSIAAANNASRATPP